MLQDLASSTISGCGIVETRRDWPKTLWAVTVYPGERLLDSAILSHSDLRDVSKCSGVGLCKGPLAAILAWVLSYSSLADKWQ